MSSTSRKRKEKVVNEEDDLDNLLSAKRRKIIDGLNASVREKLTVMPPSPNLSSDSDSDDLDDEDDDEEIESVHAQLRALSSNQTETFVEVDSTIDARLRVRPALREAIVRSIEERIQDEYPNVNDDESDYRHNVALMIDDYVLLYDGVIERLSDSGLQARVSKATRTLTRRLNKYYVWAFRESMLQWNERQIVRLMHKFCIEYANLNQLERAVFWQGDDEQSDDWTLSKLNERFMQRLGELVQLDKNLELLDQDGSGLRGSQVTQRKLYHLRIAKARTQIDRANYSLSTLYNFAKTKLEYANVHSQGFAPQKYTHAMVLSLTHQFQRKIMPQVKEKSSPYQTFVYHMLPRLMAANLRFLGKPNATREDQRDIRLYRERKTSEGKSTYTWEPYMKLVDFISNAVQTIRGGDNYLLDLVTSLRGSSMTMAFIDFVTTGNYTYLPKLVRDRYVFSYRNGVYFVRENRFHAYNDGPLDPVPVACNYINSVFEPSWVGAAKNNPKFTLHEDRLDPNTKRPTVTFQKPPNMNPGTWRSIETPIMDAILTHQGIANKPGQNILDWWYALTGRMLHENGTDNWQVVLFLLGYGGTGKSTVMQVVMNVYDTDDVQGISNRIEDVFGLSSYVSSFMNVALDVNKKFRLDPTAFKSIITGEPYQVAIKNKTSQKIVFPGSWAFVANEFPGWDEKGDSVERRLALFLFNNSVSHQKKNQGLLERMRKEEIGKFIVKANRAYREMHVIVGNRDVHHVWPSKYFDINTQVLRASINPLGRFLCDREFVHRDPNLNDMNFVPTESKLYCPLDAFKKAFETYCQRKKINVSEGWSPQFYTPILEFYNHPLISGTKTMLYPRQPKEGMEQKSNVRYKTICGLDLVGNLSFTERRALGLDETRA